MMLSAKGFWLESLVIMLSTTAVKVEEKISLSKEVCSNDWWLDCQQ